MLKGLWEPMTRVWQQAQEQTSRQDAALGRTQATWAATLKSWQNILSVTSEPAGMEALMSVMHLAPDIMLKFSKTGFQGFINLQEQFSSRIENMEASTESFNFDELDREFLNHQRKLYEKEFRQVLNMPQLGLSRFYQERMLAAIDKFNLFQNALNEFLHTLYLPIEKSYRTLMNNVAQLAENDDLPGDAKAYYQMWIKILERQYMTLYKSPEYTQTLGDTLNAMNSWLLARQEVLTDALKTMPMVTQSDMREQYKEIYELKKEIKSIKKQFRTANFKPVKLKT